MRVVRTGDLLVADKIITEAQLKEALAYHVNLFSVVDALLNLSMPDAIQRHVPNTFAKLC